MLWRTLADDLRKVADKTLNPDVQETFRRSADLYDKMDGEAQALAKSRYSRKKDQSRLMAKGDAA
jgi:hypothetical protein